MGLQINQAHIWALAASLWDSAICLIMRFLQEEMNPCIFVELQVSDIIITGILVLCLMYVLTWLIFLQAQVDIWFKDW